MHDPRIQLKNRWMALLLAWLIPGAGHFYQGRMFKGAIYSVCILGLFLSGLAMADWSTINPPPVGREFTSNKVLLLKYTAQSGVGLPAIYGLLQSSRFYSEDNRDLIRQIDTTQSASFEGFYLGQKPDDVWADYRSAFEARRPPVETLPDNDPNRIPAQGTITLTPQRNEFGNSIAANLTGTIDDQKFDGPIGTAMLAPAIRSDSRRIVLVNTKLGGGHGAGTLVASIPRPVLHHVCSPLRAGEEHLLHGRFGNYLELWAVCTWLAGLLNYLAMWDAFDGPAYGYGDEKPSDEPKPGTDPIPTVS